MKQLALFDFDHTLTRRDTFIGFGRFARGNWRFMAAVAMASPQLAAWKLGLTSASRAKERLFGLLFGGMTLEQFDRLGADFANWIDRHLRADTVAQMEQLKAQGATIAIVSASIANWIKPWAARHGVDLVIATEAATQVAEKAGNCNNQPSNSNGISSVLTGRFATPNCHGQEKVNRIRAAIPNLADFTAIHAFGNLPSDAPMLSLATHPVNMER